MALGDYIQPPDLALSQMVSVDPSSGIASVPYEQQPQSVMVPQAGIAQASVPMQSVPMQSVPMQSVPMQSVPMQSVPMQSVPMQSVPMQSVPMQSVPMQSVQEPQSFQPPPLTTNYTPDMTSSQFRQAVADKFNAAKSAPLPKGIPADTRKASNAPIPEESTAPVAPPPPSDVWTGQSVQPPGGAVAPETPSDVWTGQSVQPPGGVYFAGKPTTPTTPVTGTAAKTGTQVPGVPDWLTNQVHPYGVGKLGMQREALENAQTTAAQNVLAERGGMEGLHTEKQLDIEAQQQQLAALQAKRDADFEEYKQKRAAADADAAKFHMDPDRYMKNKNVFAKILLAIAAGAQGVAMGAMKQAGPNPVVEQMDRDISRDMEAQKAEYEQKLRQGQNIDNLYSMALKHTGDEEQAMTMGHQLALQAVQAKMDGVQRRVEDADLKGKFDVAIKSATYQQSIDEAKLAAAAAAQQQKQRQELVNKVNEARAKIMLERPDITDPAELDRRAYMAGAGIDLGSGPLQAKPEKGKVEAEAMQAEQAKQLQALQRVGQKAITPGTLGAGLAPASTEKGQVAKQVESYNAGVKNYFVSQLGYKPNAAEEAAKTYLLSTSMTSAANSLQMKRFIADVNSGLLRPKLGKGGSEGESEGGG